MAHRTLSILIPLFINGGIHAQLAGQPDFTFADSGYVITNGSVYLEHAESVLLTPDGRTIAVGTAVMQGNDIGLAKFLSNGQPDPIFGTNGSVAIHVDGTEFGNGSALLDDGGIVIAGMTHTTAAPSSDKGLIIRLDGTGVLDAVFGDAGIHRVHFPGEAVRLFDVAVQADERIVAVGHVGNDLLIHRVLANGTPDPDFGDQGSVRIEDQPVGYAVALEADDVGILVTGRGILRLLSDGEPDSSGFGIDGRAVLPADVYGNVLLHDVLVQPDGRILATGRSSPPPDTLVVLRLLPNGTPDSSFAQDGSLRLPVQYNSSGMALALQPDGRIVVTGSTEDVLAQTTSVLLARIDPNGVPDATFGQDGIVLFSVNAPQPHAELGTGAAIGPDGTITICASYFGAPAHGFLVARFQGDGPFTSTPSIAVSTGRVFPVPTSDAITVECPPCVDRMATMDLFDLTGRHVWTMGTSKTELGHSTMVDLRGVPSGTYQLRLACGDQVHAYPVIIH